MFKSDTVLVASHCVEVCLFTGHKKEEKRQTTDNSRLGDKKSDSLLQVVSEENRVFIAGVT